MFSEGLNGAEGFLWLVYYIFRAQGLGLCGVDVVVTTFSQTLGGPS